MDVEPRGGGRQRALPAQHAADQGPGEGGHPVHPALLPRREPQSEGGVQVRRSKVA